MWDQTITLGVGLQVLDIAFLKDLSLAWCLQWRLPNRVAHLGDLLVSGSLMLGIKVGTLKSDFFMWAPGTELRSLCFCSKSFNN